MIVVVGVKVLTIVGGGRDGNGVLDVVIVQVIWCVNSKMVEMMLWWCAIVLVVRDS